MWLLSKNEVIIDRIDLLEGVHTETLSGANYLEFTCNNQIEKNDRVLYRDPNLEWHEFIVMEIEEHRNGAFIYAEHSSYELLGYFIEDLRSEQQPNEHLNRLLAKTRWEVGTVEYRDKIKKMYYRKSVYEAIGDLVRSLGAEIQFRIEVKGNRVVKRYVDIVEQRGFDVGKRFEYAKDIEKATKTVLRDNVITALYGFGKGEEIGDGYGRRLDFGDLNKPDSPTGQMYITDDDARAEWGINDSKGNKRHFFGKVVFDDIEDKEELYKATKAKLQVLNKPLINYSTEVIMLPEPHENVSIGDTIAIIDNDFNNKDLRVKGRIFKLERDLVNPIQSKVEIGNYMSDILDETISLDDIVNNMRDKQGAWDTGGGLLENGQIPSSKIKDLLEAWNKEINKLGGFVYGADGEGLMTYDRAIDDNPTQVVQIVGGAIRIANSKKSNGDWDWRTVMTADGIHGEEIIANSITTEHLSNGVGSEIDLSNNESIKLLVKQLKSRNVWVNSSGIAGLRKYTFESEPIVMTPNKYYMGIESGYVMGSGIPIMRTVKTDTIANVGLQFFLHGKAKTHKTVVKASEPHFLRVLGKGKGSLVSVELREYNNLKELLKTTAKFIEFEDTEEFETYEAMIDFMSSTHYVELVFDFKGDINNTFTIADGMLTEGAYQEYEPTAEELVLFTQSSIELIEDDIKLVAENTDVLGNRVNAAEQTISAVEGITSSHENALNSSKARLSAEKGLETWGNGITAYDSKGNRALYLDSNTGDLTLDGDIYSNKGMIGDWTLDGGVLYGKIGNRYTTMKATGNVAYATSSPDPYYTGGARLQIWHDGTLRFADEKSENAGWLYSDGGNLTIGSKRYINIKPSYTMYVDGYLHPEKTATYWLGNQSLRWQGITLGSGGVNESSDMRLKENIQEIPKGLLKEFAEIEPKMYEMDNKIHFGYIAQDIERALFRYASREFDDFVEMNKFVNEVNMLSKSESYMALVYNQVAAVKEAETKEMIRKQQEEIDELKQIVKELIK